MIKEGVSSIVVGSGLSAFDIFFVHDQYFGQISVSGGVLVGMGIVFIISHFQEKA
jgi:hypothetical protein